MDEQPFGEGGQGSVYHAYDHQRKRQCAIKVIPITSADQEKAIKYLVETHKKCRDLRFIPQIYDDFPVFDGHGQYAYVVMEYIDGTQLNQLPPFTPNQVLAFLHMMLVNLEDMHGRNVVHRDIKPENILLGNDTYFLVDFGIAKNSDRTLTAMHPWGSEKWAPPEQLAGLGTDNRTDLYSLGATAYWLLTGTYINNFNKNRPQRERVLQQLRARQDVPPTLAETLIALLQLDLAARPPTAKDARERLYPPLPPPPPRRNKRGTSVIVLAGLVAAALGMCGYAAVNNRHAIVNVVQGVREGFNGVDVSPSPSPSVARAPFPTNNVQQQIRAAGGTWGVVVLDLASNTTVHVHNADTAFPAASLAKLPIVIAAYRLAEQGELNLDEQLTLEAQDKVGGTGTLQAETTGTRYTIRDLCRRMLTASDNTAGNMMLRHLGFDTVNRISSELGASATQLQRRFADVEAQAAGRENLATAGDIARLLQALSGDGVLTEAHRAEILDALRSADRDKLAKLLPPNIDIAHKTGVLTGVEHDAGIVTITRGQYIIVMMSQDLPDAVAGQNTIAAVSQTVYAWFGDE